MPLFFSDSEIKIRGLKGKPLIYSDILSKNKKKLYTFSTQKCCTYKRHNNRKTQIISFNYSRWKLELRS